MTGSSGGPLRETLRKLMAEVFEIGVDEVTAESAIGNLEGWDSLGHIRLVAALELAFGVTLTADDIVAMTSVAAIESRLGARTAP